MPRKRFTAEEIIHKLREPSLSSLSHSMIRASWDATAWTNCGGSDSRWKSTTKQRATARRPSPESCDSDRIERSPRRRRQPASAVVGSDPARH